jgi:septin family protein
MQEENNKTQYTVDLLTEDPPIKGQEYGVYSFLSPDNVKNCTIRAFKNRGNFGSYDEACKHAEKLRNLEPAFNVFVGENFKWAPVDPDPNMIKDNTNYYEPKLQELMKGTLENHEKAKNYEAQRKRNMIEENIQKELQKQQSKSHHNPEDRKERMRQKLDQRKQEAVKEEKQKEQVQQEQQEQQVPVDEEKLKENTNEINEKLEKLKKLYGDLTKDK